MVRAAALAFAVLVVAVPAGAQGHRGAPPGQIKQPPKSGSQGANGTPTNGTTAPGESTPASLTTPRSFGAWLDDATLAPEKLVWVTLATTRWSALAGHGI